MRCRKMLPLFAATLLTMARASDIIPDFLLQDVNRESPRNEAQVSPRDYVLQVSGYYFGHAG
jgi:hypothetical protein